jgi:amino acid adenylation domain-containing protein
MYVVYTSGTTGNPKGIMIEHGNIANLANFMHRHTGSDFSRVLQFANIGFDVCYQEIFGTLTGGGTLFLAAPDVRQHIPELFGMLDREVIKSIFLPASFVKFIFNSEEYREHFPKQVTHIIAAGEQLVVGGIFRRYLQQNRIVLHNHYGPSESHVVTTFTMAPGDRIPGLPPIGKPVSNTSIHILGPQRELLPIGITGELFIGGAQVGRGYLNRPELTAERFIYRSYTSYRSYKTYYQTGDLARWLSGGVLEFLGRKDRQVKIRGFRIELGEIESRLLAHPGVTDAAVIDRESDTGEKYLCAYIVAPGITTGELPGYLSAALPDYMIPAYFVPLTQIPLTPNRKVDRQALPEPRLERNNTYVPAQTETEKKLVDIWANILTLEPGQIGIDDNFFALGGHSLKATILVSRIEKTMGVNLALQEIFTHPTVRSLARHVAGAPGTGHSVIEPVEEREYYPLSPAQKRLYILQQMDKNSMSYNMPGLLILEGDLQKEKLQDVVNRLIRRHESFRTALPMVGEEPAQRVLPLENAALSVDYFDLAENKATAYKWRKNPQGIQEKIIRGFIRPFDLAEAPLLRVGLIKLAAREHVFMFDMHHVITDGTSQGIFTREFMQLYGGLELPPLTLQYKDYSQWRRSGPQAAGLRKQGIYWRERFQGQLPVLRLPYDFPRPPVQRFEGGKAAFLVEEAEISALRSIARQEDGSLFVILSAIFNVLLGKLSGQEDIITGIPVAARRHADLETITGMFVNTLAMRSFPTGEKTFKTFLREVTADTMQAFENQEYPFEELVESVNAPRDPGRNPLFDVMFSLQNWEQPGGGIPGLAMKPYPFESHISRFDLNLDAVEMGSPGPAAFSLQYSAALFEECTISRFVRYFKTIISQVIAPGGLEKKLCGIEILDQEEKQRLLELVDDREGVAGAEQTIHRLFEVQAEKSGDRTALVYGAHVLTYGELNRRAGRLAGMLREKGIQENDIVAIKMKGPMEMAAGILAVLKTGGAYLPIDPGTPRERSDYMLKDSQAALVLTDDMAADGLIIDDNEPRPGFSSHHGNLPAYIIYTPDTAGQPKGVVVEHRGVVNMLLCRREHYALNGTHTALQLFSHDCDGFVASFFTPLSSGARLIMLHDRELTDIRKIKQALIMHGVTHFICTPTVYRTLIDSLSREEASALQTVTLTGEQIPLDVLDKTAAKSETLEIVNEYGVPEGPVMSTLYPHQERDRIIKTGRPIRGVTVHILNRYGEAQPAGAAGEMWIGGIGVARGYLNRPALTAERFIYRSYKTYMTYKAYNTKRIFKTGDLARWLADGNIEFLGR